MIPDFRAPFFRLSWVRVLNGSGEVIPPHAVMRIISGSITDEEMVFQVGQPETASLDQVHLVNGPGQIYNDGWATFLADGGIAKVSGTPSINDEIGPSNASWALASGGSGFKVVGDPTTSNGIDVVLAVQVATPSSFEFHRGVTDGAISKGGSGTVSRYNAGTTTDSGIDDTVNNEIANIGAGKVIYYVLSGGNYYAITGECPLT